jgi:hypothetical protein
MTNRLSSLVSRRCVLGVGVASAGFALLGSHTMAASTAPVVTAYRDPGCGCCEKWAGLMKDAGFAITLEDDPNLAERKARLGVPKNLTGCHTALVGDYVIEGHVPPDDIILLLAERPVALGLAVPGMPAESPGMEMGGARQPFDVVLMGKDGATKVYAHHG